MSVDVASSWEIFNTHARREDGRWKGIMAPSRIGKAFCGDSDDYIGGLTSDIVFLASSFSSYKFQYCFVGSGSHLRGSFEYRDFRGGAGAVG